MDERKSAETPSVVEQNIANASYLIPSFSSKRGHVGEKHVLIGRKCDKLGNQTCEV